MSFIRNTALAVAGLAAFALGQVCLAQEEPLSQKIDLYLRDADLVHATTALTMQTGISFIIDAADTEAFRRINLNLPGVSAEDAIRYVAQAAGGYAERDANGVYIIRFGAPRPAEAVAAESQQTILPMPKLTERIFLTQGDGRAIYDTLVGGFEYDPESGMRFVHQYLEEANTPKGIPASTINLLGSNSGDSSPFTLSGAPMRSATGATSNTMPAPLGESGFNIPLPGMSAGQGGLGGGGLGGGGQGGGQGGQGQGGQSVTSLEGGQAMVPAGIDQVIYDPATNSFIVLGTPDAIRQLRGVIEQFDVAPEQVVIKVEFITTSSGLDQALGIDWLYQRGTISTGNRPGSFARASDPIFINYATGNITTRLRALLTSGWGRTVNAPLVRTLNNQPALVQATTVTTIFVNQVVATGGGGVIVVPQPIQLPVQTALAVRPRINGPRGQAGRTVTMGLSPTIAEFGQLRRGPDGQEIPDQLSQTISVVARVRDGETIALAGLTRKSDNYSESRIPILSDLPIIGQLFRGRNRQQTNSELLIFVTPTIVDEDNYGLGP